jgi:hypothetical protein
VEGKFDREFIEEAFRFYRPKRPVRVVDLPVLDDATGGGGVERIQRYIKDNANAIRSRRSEAPLIVVLDWDAAKKVDQFKKLVDSPSVYKVLTWRAEAANPKASRVSKELKGFIVTECLTSPSNKKLRSVAKQKRDNSASTSWKQLITIK